MLFLLRLLALALFIYSVSLVFTSNFNMGNLLVWLLTADENGIAYNINADTAAAAIAIALHAEKFVSMTDIVGLLYDKDDESTLIPEVEISEIEGYKAHGVISGGMIPKIEGMADAIYEGVHEAVIIDGRVPHSVLLEMFSDRGSGTLFYRRGNR